MTFRSAKFSEAMSAYNSDRAEEALRLMEDCARAGDPMACFTAALWHRDGEGAPASAEHSAKWIRCLEELAAQGNTEAQWELGQNHRFGNVVPLDVELANFWLERAAEGGWAEAQHHLGWYFETGQYNYPVDPESAETWYRRAFEQEHPETLYLYAIRAFRDGRPTEEAIRLLGKAASKGFIDAEEVLKSYVQ